MRVPIAPVLAQVRNNSVSSSGAGGTTRGVRRPFSSHGLQLPMPQWLDCMREGFPKGGVNVPATDGRVPLSADAFSRSVKAVMI